MADLLQYLELPIIYPLTSNFLTGEEVSEIDIIKLKNLGLMDDDEYEEGIGYYNISVAIPFALNPKCFVPKDRVKKIFYTEVIFEDGTVVFAKGKPEAIYKLINDYAIKIESMSDNSDNNNKNEG